jgi:hypothetical protein
VMLDAIDHATTTISLETYTGRARSARSSQMPSPCARATGTTPSEPSTIGKGIAPRAPSFSGRLVGCGGPADTIFWRGVQVLRGS